MHRVIEVPISEMKRLAIDSGRVREKQSAVQKRCSVDHSISFTCELARTTFNFVGRNFDRVMGWDDHSSGTKADFIGTVDVIVISLLHHVARFFGFPSH